MRREPSIYRWWGSAADRWPNADGDSEPRAIWSQQKLIGFVQWHENQDERYRHAGIDLFLSEEFQGRGLGRESVSLVLQHLVASGHHRIVIDPAADNERAVSCYRACGFTAVGTMRQYEQDNDGAGWHDGLLMEYVVEG
jgi:aminoglycoside 6'-N-acetyltransferase